MTNEDLGVIFTYHAPFGDQPSRYGEIREKVLGAAVFINAMCPESREKSLALTALQQAVMWANAAIALHERPPEEG